MVQKKNFVFGDIKEINISENSIINVEIYAKLEASVRSLLRLSSIVA
jgi:hypothetical protein